MSLFSWQRNKKIDAPQPAAPSVVDDEPLERLAPMATSIEGNEIKMRTAAEDSVDAYDAKSNVRAADSEDEQAPKGDTPETIFRRAADAGDGSMAFKGMQSVAVPNTLQNWYTSNAFIGHQMCAIMAQHWLIEKCCAMPGRDAVRNGYEVSSADGSNIDPKVIERIGRFDRKMKVLQHCAEAVKFNNIFGIRIVLFEVHSDDAQYYEKPFNIDGVTRGSYRGMAQIDPYWVVPLLDNDASVNTASQFFYDPTFWVINGKKVHRTHLHIIRGAEVADILKPSYYYGGVPLTQRIFERVYAAERTANEAPLLAMSKRTTVLKVDAKKATANFAAVAARLMEWITFRDNHGVKVIDINESLENQDTSLADLDVVIMTQFQLVAAIAGVPATKLMGTSPKGFGASGEYEELSYHELLETIQTDWLDGLVNRHHELLCKSLGLPVSLEIGWNPVGTKTPEQLAELNEKKANTAEKYILNGVIAPDEERQRLRNDKHSGYVLLDDGASEEIEQAEPAPEEGQPTPAAESGAELADGETDDIPEELPDVPKAEEVEVQPIHRSVKPSIKPSVKPSVDRGGIPNLDNLIDLVQKVINTITGSAADADEGKRFVEFNGYKVGIETNKGEVRNGVGPNGKEFSNVMPFDYGYIVGAKANDGDSVDCFLGPNAAADYVYVINQNNPVTGEFDEHKVMLGFDDDVEANLAYDAAYSVDWEGFGNMVGMTHSQFRDWLGAADKSIPATDNNE